MDNAELISDLKEELKLAVRILATYPRKKGYLRNKYLKGGS